MSRRTYTEKRVYSARVMRFRQGVYGKRDGLTAGCRVLLLRLSDDMDAKCIVSIPRSQLADEFGVAPARITEWIKQARELGFLDVVRRARPGVTATYQGLRVVSEVRQSVPLDDESEVRETGPLEVRENVPLSEVQRYARAVPQEVGTTEGNGKDRETHSPERGSEEDEWHGPPAFLAAAPLTTDCPHGIPNGDQPDPWDKANPREPACPACRFDIPEPRTKRERKSA